MIALHGAIASSRQPAPGGGGGVPVASFTFTPSYPAEGDTVDFTDTSTNSPTSWSWKKDGVEFSTVQNPADVDLGVAGTYTIELTATNASGSDSDSQDVTVFPVGAVDSDAAAFATRHGSLTDAQFAAVNAAVLQVKDAGLWTAIKAWYPIIGGTETLHEYNLRSSSFDLVITDATNKLTHDGNGILRNGIFGPTIGTGITPSTHLTSINALTLVCYSRTDNTSSDTPVIRALNSGASSQIMLQLAISGGSPGACIGGTSSISSAATRTGTWIATRTSSTSIKLYRGDASSTSVIASSTAANAGALPDTEISFMTQSTQACANQICGGMILDTGVTDTEAESLRSIVENMQAALGRSAFANNTDEQNFADGIDNLLDGTDDVEVFSGAGVRNASCWLPNATWVPVGGNNGVPITPRHMLFVGHWRPADGATITFYAADNTLVTRTIVTSTIVVGMPSGMQGVYVAKLDSDLPGTITIPKLGPANLDALCRVSLLPAVSVHRGTQAYVGVCQWTDSARNQLFLNQAFDATRAAVFAQATSGASGSWAGLRAADTGEPVTLFVTESGNFTPGSGVMSAGTYVGAFLTEIPAAIATVGAEGHSVTVWAP